MIQITKACKVLFMKARDSFVVRYREESVNWKKEQDDQVYSNTRVSTQVNTSQHEPDTNQRESDTSQHESIRA